MPGQRTRPHFGHPQGTDEPDLDPAHGASVTVAPTVEPPLEPPLSLEQALQVAERLAPHLVLPGDCKPSPLNRSGWLPNAPRPYRGGTHQGVDFQCPRGHPMVAVLDGHVVVAVGDYEDASSQRLNEVLIDGIQPRRFDRLLLSSSRLTQTRTVDRWPERGKSPSGPESPTGRDSSETARCGSLPSPRLLRANQ